MGPWHGDLSCADGRGIHGLRVALGPDVILGCQCDCLAIRFDSHYRRRPVGLDPW